MKFSQVFFLFIVLTGPQEASDSNIFTDKEYGYRLSYPVSWKAAVYRSGMVLANLSSDDKRSGVQIRITSRNSDISVFLEKYKTEFENSMNSVLVSETRKYFGRIHGYAVSFSARRNGVDYLLKSYIIPDAQKGRMFILQAGCPADEKNRLESVLDSIADSFENIL